MQTHAEAVRKILISAVHRRVFHVARDIAVEVFGKDVASRRRAITALSTIIAVFVDAQGYKIRCPRPWKSMCKCEVMCQQVIRKVSNFRYETYEPDSMVSIYDTTVQGRVVDFELAKSIGLEYGLFHLEIRKSRDCGGKCKILVNRNWMRALMIECAAAWVQCGRRLGIPRDIRQYILGFLLYRIRCGSVSVVM